MSLPCYSVSKTKEFYVKSIGTSIGRSAQNWVDIDLFGNQLTFIKSDKFNFSATNYVFEGHILPSFHFGIILNQEDWQSVYQKLKRANVDLVEKITFLKDKTGEHASFFVHDPNGYMLEFKNFKELKEIFKS
jgi:extradiol dioxygenase family protein